MSVHNTLYFKGVNHNLIPPLIIRLDGLEVHDCPKLFYRNPKMSHHSIILPYLQLHLTLPIKGVISYLPTRMPDEGEEGKLDKHQLIPDKPV